MIERGAPPKVRVLRHGWIVRDGSRVVDASSSATLIEEGDRRLLVDTGASKDSDALICALSEIDLRPQDIDDVVNTHLHIDHCGCNDLFTNARFHAHASEAPPLETVRFTGDVDLSPHVRVVHTPGHTRGCVSVFVESDTRYAICGDALPTEANYRSWVPPGVHFDRSLALASMGLIVGWAQTVVPGHDKPFIVMGKK